MLLINTAIKDPIVYLLINIVFLAINSLRIKYGIYTLGRFCKRKNDKKG